MIVKIRAFVFGLAAPIFEEVLTITGNSLAIGEPDLNAMRIRHEAVIAGRDHCIEFEFEPDEKGVVNFARFGTDPRLMDLPISLAMIQELHELEMIMWRHRANARQN